MKAFSINKLAYYPLLLGLFLLSGCAVQPDQDPLKNTKQLVKSGHKTLYENGAFHVPSNQVRLIPPGPPQFEFALECVGIRANHLLTTC